VMGKRELAAKALCAVGLTELSHGVRSWKAYDLPILAYHRVRDFDAQYEFDLDLVSATPAQFRWQVDYVRKHFAPIRLADLVGFLDEGRPLPRNAILITFDDGFLDNYETAFPILKDVGVPATFFVSTGYIGGTATFWFDEVYHIILTTREKRIAIVDGPVLEFNDREERRRAAASLLRQMKKVDNANRLAWIDALRKATGVGLPLKGSPDSRVMNWEQIREMSSQGMDIASHTVTHPILSQVSNEQLTRELVDSKKAIANETGIEPCVLAYPVGGPAIVTPGVVNAVREAGYRAAVAYFQGVNRRSALSRYALRRIPVERYIDKNLFRGSLSLPEVFLR
jgi:peptidoglycan/xylan/chitin deacetylase (PgdA/CDA1 family)